MKRILVVSCFIIISAFSALAQSESKTSLAKERADRLSDQMIRELKLNNFQASRLRIINQEKISKMMQIEQNYAGNPALVDKNCLTVCRERDKELESFLSFDQYSRYYGNRTEYYDADKNFAAKIGLIKPGVNYSINEPVSANRNPNNGSEDPVLKPKVNR